jgi:TonB family protein
MKATAIALMLLILTPNVGLAEDKYRDEANLLLRKAGDLEAFKVGEFPKYHLESHFSFHRPGMQDITGNYVRDYDSASLWRAELEFGDFTFKQVRNDSHEWTKKNNDFIPMPVEEFWRALRATSFQMRDSAVVKRVYNRKMNDFDDQCIEFQDVRGKDKEAGQICVQRDTGLVVYWQYGAREVLFSDFAPLAGSLRPRHISILLAGKVSIVADLSYTEVSGFDSDAFLPIIGGERNQACSTSRVPVAKYAPDPVRPSGNGGFKGKVIVNVKIGPDGRVQKAQVAQTVGPDLDEAAMKAVTQWQFEPGTCDALPMTVTTKVEVNFR